MQVHLSRSEGMPGQTVRAEVHSAQPNEITEVRLVVDESGGAVDWTLVRSGDGWGIEVAVPYDAPRGTYFVSLRAYGANARLIDSAQVPFTVL